MAALTFVTPTTASPVVVVHPSTPAGDTFAYSGSKEPVFVFNNGFSSSITITIPGENKTVTASGYGSGTFQRTDIVIALAAGASAVVPITTDIDKGYVDDSGNININYTSGNVLLTVFGVLL